MAGQLNAALFHFPVKKGDYLIRQGEHATAFYFIISGIVVGYTTRKKKKLTTYICAEGDTVSSISGMYGEKPSGESVFAIEDTILLGLPVETILEWIETSLGWNIIVRKILEDFYKIAHERSNVIRMGTAKEKYDYYAAEMHEHFERIPVAFIADYLNIKSKTLEKLLKDRKKNSEQLNEKLDLLIRSYLVDEESFRKQGLTLTKMAKALSIPSHQLSHFINSRYKKSFNALINTYRVIYLRNRLQHDFAWQHLKIEALGIEGGFSSRSVFFSEFKLRVGMSPAEYARSIKNVSLQ
ncbi:cyclic nucleotide-binding domain-containing protein [Pedobacter psychroterrae]|uniref:Cyclic nucleotide-binding domain-containing protein n=1 Tax=Pedobacter psychroterrae TaxID=2530453 RepID=A0A4V2MLP2_9SPHI|nr:cyclic nucleotide-binding domain-containing protein [Pedobacter psychroterrae]TCD02737.1 cyclic nucleotide-binding domain-containing protein [Pedobacter psychroterrae]